MILEKGLREPCIGPLVKKKMKYFNQISYFYHGPVYDGNNICELTLDLSLPETMRTEFDDLSEGPLS